MREPCVRCNLTFGVIYAMPCNAGQCRGLWRDAMNSTWPFQWPWCARFWLLDPHRSSRCLPGALTVLSEYAFPTRGRPRGPLAI